MFRKWVIVFLAVLVVAPMAGKAAVEQKTVWDGAYVTSQATEGLATYTQYCASCHGTTLTGGANQGAPPLKGPKFMENWREDNLLSLYTKVKTTMPRRDDKSLNEKETLDLIAYMLQANEFQTGPELNVGTLSAVQIQLKEGPKPLPNYAIVQVVGCLAQDGEDWVLTNVGQPMRLRVSDKATPAELKAAETKPLGTGTFRLQNLSMLGAFTPQAHKGHKMMAKGPLIRQSNSERVSVTELEMVDANCSSQE